MSELKLPISHVTNPWSAAVASLTLYGASLRAWSLMFGNIGAFGAILCGVLVGGGGVLLAGISRDALINKETLLAKIETKLFGYRVSQKEIDLSTAAWVRARNAGNDFMHIIIEVGTKGFSTSELMRMPYRLGKGVPLSEEWCRRIAEHLQLPNKGFKGRA